MYWSDRKSGPKIITQLTDKQFYGHVCPNSWLFHTHESFWSLFKALKLHLVAVKRSFEHEAPQGFNLSSGCKKKINNLVHSLKKNRRKGAGKLSDNRRPGRPRKTFKSMASLSLWKLIGGSFIATRWRPKAGWKCNIRSPQGSERGYSSVGTSARSHLKRACFYSAWKLSFDQTIFMSILKTALVFICLYTFKLLNTWDCA